MKKSLFTLILACIGFINLSMAQWQQTSLTHSMSNAYTINTMTKPLAVIGTNIFVSTDSNGVFISTDNGLTWDNISKNGLPDSVVVTSLVVSGGNILAGTWGAGVFLSTDNGTTWTPDTSYMNGYCFISTMVVSGTNIFVCANNISNVGLFISTNENKNWTNITGNLYTGTSNIFSILVNNLGIFIGGDEFGSQIFLSTDTGKNWTGINTGLSTFDILSLGAIGQNMYLGSNGNGVYISSSTNIWTIDTIGMGNISVNYFLSGNDTNLFAGTNNGVFISTKNNLIWKAVNNGFPVDTTIFGINNSDTIISYPTVSSLIINNGYVFVATNDGLWKRPLSDFEFCGANFSVAGDSIRHNYTLTNNSFGTLPIQYTWSWGDGDTTVTSQWNIVLTHIDSVANPTICLSIIDSIGCQSAFCDNLFNLARTTIGNIPISLTVTIDSTIFKSQQPDTSSIPTGTIINILQTLKVKIYPNPVSNNLIIYVDDLFFKNTTVAIYNTLGQMIKSPIYMTANQLSIDVGDIAPGVYYIQFLAKDDNVTRKFIKE